MGERTAAVFLRNMKGRKKKKENEISLLEGQKGQEEFVLHSYDGGPVLGTRGSLLGCHPSRHEEGSICIEEPHHTTCLSCTMLVPVADK